MRLEGLGGEVERIWTGLGWGEIWRGWDHREGDLVGGFREEERH